MRLSLVLAALAACVSLAGCNSTASIDGMGIPRPSMETTNSIARAPRPVVAVAQAEYPVETSVLRAPLKRAPAKRALPAPAPVETDTSVDAILSAPEQQTAASPRAVKKQPLIDEQPPVIRTSAYAASRVHGPKFRDADPISFGKASPRRYPVHGVDISRWQGSINWEKLRAQGANFAYIKATDGGDHLDPMFRKNWRAANEAGMKRGAYHFFYWCRSGAEQAEWFIRNVPKSANALPPVIDVEYNHQSSCKKRPSRETVLKKMKSFMDRIEAHYGQRPVIYTAPDFYEDNLQGAFRDYPFWLRAVAQHPSKVYPGRNWVFWQYSGTGLSKGVKGEIDLNVFNGDPSQWGNWLARTAG